jgi:acyl-coenzyme A synthetase/AMP-(fatty) acid ligase
VTCTECNSTAKIVNTTDQSAIRNPQSEIPTWHRMGDVGYLDDSGRFWYCGRKSQRVESANGPLFTECAEAVFNTHPAVRRSALVAVRSRQGVEPVMVVELDPAFCGENWHRELTRLAAAHRATEPVAWILEYPELPVDIRHNSKIRREELAIWATRMINKVRH